MRAKGEKSGFFGGRSNAKTGEVPPTDRTRPTPDEGITAVDTSRYQWKDKGVNNGGPSFKRKVLLPGFSPVRDERAEALKIHEANRAAHLDIMNNARALRGPQPTQTPTSRAKQSARADEWIEYL